MNKIRLIPVLFIKNGFIVRSENFLEHKIIGNVVNQVKRFNEWNIDELIFIDISRNKKYDSNRDDHKIKRVNSLDEILEFVSNECFMPLCFGGGIRDLETIKKYIKNGADKVSVNSLIYDNPNIIEKAVNIFGSQAIIASIDYRLVNNEIHFFKNNGSKRVNINFNDLTNLINSIGVGEVFLNSIDKDGSGEGYDLKIIKNFVDQINLPIIACGGALTIQDFKVLSEIDKISGVAAGNIFHFTENIYPRAKSFLKKNNLNFR